MQNIQGIKKKKDLLLSYNYQKWLSTSDTGDLFDHRMTHTQSTYSYSNWAVVWKETFCVYLVTFHFSMV